MSHQVDITIIGAGVVGLAIAARVADQSREVYVLEKNRAFGQEVSSRHSGVIHSGLYYPPGSLKARMCVAGNRVLYELAERHGIGHTRLGKVIVATNDKETEELNTLLERGQKNGVAGLSLLSEQELRKLEPNVAGVAAIFSPTTGIIDAHALMKHLLTRARERGAQIVYQAKVTGIERVTDGYTVTVADNTGEFPFHTGILINCAGLHSDKIAELAGIDTTKAGYRLHYCKGEYFSVSGHKSRLVKRLIYPVPLPNLTGVGIHVTFDLEGRMRLGPSAYYVNNLDYSVDHQNKSLFYDSVRKLLPLIEYDDLAPEMAGIRPKLQEPGGGFRDFVIQEESDKGLPGLINLIGIESPGLTASPAIAEYVDSLVKEFLDK